MYIYYQKLGHLLFNCDQFINNNQHTFNACKNYEDLFTQLRPVKLALFSGGTLYIMTASVARKTSDIFVIRFSAFVVNNSLLASKSVQIENVVL